MSTELKTLEKKVFNQDNTITELREQNHKFELQLCEMVGTLTRVNESQIKFGKQLNVMDTELKKSFKERDDEITKLRIGQAKIFAYAVAVFTVISVAVQMILPLN